jgi:hypothetical protein
MRLETKIIIKYLEARKQKYLIITCSGVDLIYYIEIKRGRDRDVVGFTAVCAISAYHN